MPKNKTVLLLINIGSPSELSVNAIRTYLRNFLMDPYVIQIPYLLRYILFYLLICNIRAPRTFLKYKSIWRPDGSPFHIYSENFRKSVENILGFRVINMMMYSEPGFEKAFTELKSKNYAKIIVCPMYPQHAESSSVSSLEKFRKLFIESGLTAEIKYVSPFYKEHFFIESLQNNITTRHPDYHSYDHIVFSYHGLPQSHVDKSSVENNYQKQCFRTTELLAEKLKLEKKNYVTCFQSRVGLTKWIRPYLDQTCEALAKTGKTNLLIVSPSFVVDGLETLQEIADLEKNLQLRYKIRLHLVTGLNSETIWIKNFTEYINTLILP